MNDELMTTTELAKYLRVGPDFVKNLEKRKDKPLIPIRINPRGHRRYLKSEINKYFFGEE